MKNKTKLPIMLLILALMMSACGPSLPSVTPTAKPIQPAIVASFPVTIQNRLGSIVISTEPKRVIALSNGDAEAAVVSGVIPIAIAKDGYAESGIAPWLEEKIAPATTQLIDFESEIPFETIAALKPDLILAVGVYGIDEASYAKLSQVAPTIMDLKGWGIESWQDQTVRIGQALGQAEKAHAAVSETEAAVKKAKADYPGLAGKTFSLSLMYGANSVRSVRAPDDFAIKFLDELGLVLAPALVKEDAKVTDDISFERLDLIDADLMILGFLPVEPRTSFEANPLAQQLKAVRNKGYLAVDLETISTMRNPSVLGSRWVLEQLRPGFDKLTAQ